MGLATRLGRLIRDTWWLLVIVAFAAVLFAWLIDPILGLVVPAVIVPVYIWFALIRYDGSGDERSDRMH
jgi:hypothetical protein